MNGDKYTHLPSMTPNEIFQYSTSAASHAGFSIGEPRTTTDLTSHATHGIGKFEDGTQMILLDSEAYQLRKDGSALPAPDARLAFAMITKYQPTYQIQVPELSSESLEDLISSPDLVRSINTLVPFQITARFTSVVLETGGTHKNITGKIFGFVVPRFMKNICGPRVHASFLDEDENKGGLVSEFEVYEGVALSFAKCSKFILHFPQDAEWEAVKLVCD